MSVQPIVSVTFSKNMQKQPPKSSFVKNNVASNNFELPGYKMSFGMAHVDVPKIKRVYELSEKYTTTVDANPLKTRLDEIESTELKEICNEIVEKEQSFLPVIFTKPTDFQTKRLIAHKPAEGVLKVMNDFIKENCANAEEILKKIYLTPDVNGQIPLMTFDRVEDIIEMNNALSEKDALDVYRYKNPKEPNKHMIFELDKEGMIAEVIKKLSNSKEALKGILFATDYNNNFVNMGGVDIKQFLETYKNDKSTIVKYLFTDGDRPYSLNTLLLGSAEDDTINNIFSFLTQNRNYDLLISLCSNKDRYDHLFTDAVNPFNATTLNDNIMKLITDSDLTIRDSLDMLKKNINFLCKHNGVGVMNMIEENLNEQLREAIRVAKQSKEELSSYCHHCDTEG